MRCRGRRCSPPLLPPRPLKRRENLADSAVTGRTRWWTWPRVYAAPDALSILPKYELFAMSSMSAGSSRLFGLFRSRIPPEPPHRDGRADDPPRQQHREVCPVEAGVLGKWPKQGLVERSHRQHVGDAVEYGRVDREIGAGDEHQGEKK